MGNLLIVIGIPLSILLLGIILIFTLSKKSKNNSNSEKPLEPENNTHYATTSTPPTPKSKGTSKISNWFNVIAVMFLVIALIIAGVWAIGFVTKTYNSMKNAYHSPDKHYRTILVPKDSLLTIHFDNNLSEETFIDPREYDEFKFINATQPFCVYNKNGARFCGEKGSDPDMGDSPANRFLRFISQNGEKGEISIQRMKYQKIEVTK